MTATCVPPFGFVLSGACRNERGGYIVKFQEIPPHMKKLIAMTIGFGLVLTPFAEAGKNKPGKPGKPGKEKKRKKVGKPDNK